MQKKKTKKSLVKKLRITKTNKVLRRKNFTGHNKFKKKNNIARKRSSRKFTKSTELSKSPLNKLIKNQK